MSWNLISCRKGEWMAFESNPALLIGSGVGPLCMKPDTS